MKNFSMILQYDGSGFYGAQTQKDVRTVQSCLELALSKMLHEKVSVNLSGRTDKGVHALGQVANFSVNTLMTTDKMLYFIDKILPSDIKVCSIKGENLDFHARFAAISRTYLFKIKKSILKTPFNSRYYSFIDVDYDKLKIEMLKFLGKHDFRYFCTSMDENQNSEKEIYSITFSEEESFNIYITGNSFLRTMIRIMIGTAISVVDGKLDANFISDSLLLKNLNVKRNIVSPSGLYLLHVQY